MHQICPGRPIGQARELVPVVEFKGRSPAPQNGRDGSLCPRRENHAVQRERPLEAPGARWDGHRWSGIGGTRTASHAVIEGGALRTQPTFSEPPHDHHPHSGDRAFRAGVEQATCSFTPCVARLALGGPPPLRPPPHPTPVPPPWLPLPLGTARGVSRPQGGSRRLLVFRLDGCRAPPPAPCLLLCLGDWDGQCP